MNDSIGLNNWLRDIPAGVPLNEATVSYPEYAEIRVTRAAYEDLINQVERLTAERDTLKATNAALDAQLHIGAKGQIAELKRQIAVLRERNQVDARDYEGIIERVEAERDTLKALLRKVGTLINNIVGGQPIDAYRNLGAIVSDEELKPVLWPDDELAAASKNM